MRQAQGPLASVHDSVQDTVIEAVPSIFSLRVFVFGTGAAVMAVEFGAQRLLAPYFGNSQIVWGTLIGLILLALSAGYAVGGRLADRYPYAGPLGAIVMVAGVYVALLPVVARPILSLMAGGLLRTSGGVVGLTFAAVALLFVPPVAALGAASPYAVRLALADTQTAGTRTGSLYSWSTAGSIAGTFGAVFLLIPLLGVRTTLLLAGGTLIVFGAAGMGRRVLCLLLLVPLLAAWLSPALVKPAPGVITEVETRYQFAQVYHLGRDIALSVNDAAGIQSLYTSQRLTGLYYDDFLPLPFLFPAHRPLHALLIGMAAGTIPTLMARDVRPYRPLHLTGVELDPALTQLGRRYFHLRPDAAQVVNADGRVFLESTSRRYSLMMVDAYSNEIYIPFTLSTREFFLLCQAHLVRGGLVALNVNAVSGQATLLLAFERTLAAVFPYVRVAHARGQYNYLLIGSEVPITLPALRLLPPFLRPVVAELQRSWRTARPSDGLVFTDDRAPVEELTDQMIFDHLRR